MDGEFLINTTTAGAQYHPAIGVDDSGRVAVTWDGDGPGDATGVYIKRYGLPVAFSVGDGADDATMTFSGSIANINAALEGLTYTPNNDYNGTDTLTVTTNDQGQHWHRWAADRRRHRQHHGRQSKRAGHRPQRRRRGR